MKAAPKVEGSGLLFVFQVVGWLLVAGFVLLLGWAGNAGGGDD